LRRSDVMATSMASVEEKQHGRMRQVIDGISGTITAFLAALQFLTIAPALVRRPFTSFELGRAVGFFPLVGILIGGALVGLDLLLGMVFPRTVTTVLLLAGWVLLTGALHLDGFLDTCDGLWGGSTPDDRLRILRDERVGSYAVIGGVLLLLLKYAALGAVTGRGEALVLAAMLGRWGMALAVVAFPYARSGGLGAAFKAGAGWQQAVLATAIAGVAAWFLGAWLGLGIMLLAGLATWLGALYVMNRLPGLTGDVYGAICELLEALVLLALIAGER
jgi:adenosylcobinamide-GDP ribazoletransferase